MSQFRVLVRREFMEVVRSTAYKVTTAVALLLVAGLAFLPLLIDWLSSLDQQRVAVIDEGTGLAAAVQEVLAQGAPGVRLVVEPWPGPVGEAAVEQAVRHERVDGVLWLRPAAGPEIVSARYVSRVPQPDTVAALSAAVSQAALPLRLQRAGIDPAAFQVVLDPVPVRQVALEPAGEHEESPVTQGLGYLLMFMLYIALAMYGSMALYGVTTEKMSRIAEVLLVATRPGTLLLSKLVGLGAAGLLQFLLMAAVGVGVVLFRGLPGGAMSLPDLHLSGVPLGIWAWLLVFFLLGFLMYSALYAAMGAAVGRPEEVQNASGLPTLVLVVTYIVAAASIAAPDGQVATIASFVPFLTPLIMFVRVVTLDLPPWQPLVGLTVNLVVLWLLLRWAARVYRENLLVQQPFALRRVLGLVRAARP
ncbi:hypothetical protein Tmar_1542 [Thermaerobacter marianensis DSM 12885]|uniref:ABC-2 type transporter transmembrane domain-containing protein n=1 Tax=Thermaerobacter marianensis (strain ATCC 700841 / DSM 12885 / JCM 10246 / 7p75a) TaxID=644966 RepID=E6SGR7_THEM7|nr:ABC transporter permease [Thermaerobacter marianensis]ADU51651.1 hypothetical protein Tmar_1542 [Thermaerobacter marianensis DSM 12885]